MAKFNLDPELREYATERQWEILTVLSESKSESAAAKILGLHRRCFDRTKKKVFRRAGQHGYAPERDLIYKTAPGMASKGTSIKYDGAGNIQQYWNKTKQEGRPPDEVVHLPDPKTITKLSTLYDQEGNVTQQWIAEKPDAIAQVHIWEEFAKALAEDLPRAEPIKGPSHTADELMSCYPVGDHHMGMLSWDKETGDDYDLKIGEELLIGAIDHLVKSSPDATYGTVVFLGDFMHYDGFDAVTPTHGNILDSDTRFPKMVRASIRTMRYLIDRALQKHGEVHVVVEIGNHDLASAIFLMECLDNIYENDPRVTVDTSPMHYHYFTHGKCLVGVHHGHGVKMQDLPLIMATDQPENWGESEYRYWWTGHVHHDQAKDFKGVKVESFRILPPKDAYAAQKGYRSMSDMKSILLHSEFGEVARHTVNPRMLQKK